MVVRFFWKSSYFSLYHVIVRPNKIMNRANKNWAQFLTQKNDFESTNFEMFEEVVHNFGKSDII